MDIRIIRPDDGRFYYSLGKDQGRWVREARRTPIGDAINVIAGAVPMIIEGADYTWESKPLDFGRILMKRIS